MKLPSLPDDVVASRNVRDNGAQIMMALEMLKEEINNLKWIPELQTASRKKTHADEDGDRW